MKAETWIRRASIGVGSIVVMIGVTLTILLRQVPVVEGVTLLQPRFSGLGANIVIFEQPAGRVIVDSQLPLLAPLVKAHLSPNPDDRIVITHWHPDHSGGYLALGERAQSVSSYGTVVRLSEDQEGHDLVAPGSRHQFKARPIDGLPNIIDTPHRVRGLQVLSIPAAHTDSDLVVFDPQRNVAAVGDLLWPDAFPFVDVHSGGDAGGLLRALNELIALGDDGTIYVPGHGNPVSHADLQAYANMVRAASIAAACGNSSQWQNWSSSLVPVSSWSAMVQASATKPECSDSEDALLPGAPASLQLSESFDLPADARAAFRLLALELDPWFIQGEVYVNRPGLLPDVDGVAPGDLRYCVLGESLVAERLLSWTPPHRYTYSILPDRSNVFLPVANHFGEITLTPLGPTRTRVNWKQAFDSSYPGTTWLLRWYVRDQLVKPGIARLQQQIRSARNRAMTN